MPEHHSKHSFQVYLWGFGEGTGCETNNPGPETPFKRRVGADIQPFTMLLRTSGIWRLENHSPYVNTSPCLGSCRSGPRHRTIQHASQPTGCTHFLGLESTASCSQVRTRLRPPGRCGTPSCGDSGGKKKPRPARRICGHGFTQTAPHLACSSVRVSNPWAYRGCNRLQAYHPIVVAQ